MFLRLAALLAVVACAPTTDPETVVMVVTIVGAEGVRPPAPLDDDVHSAHYGRPATESVLFARDLTEDRPLEPKLVRRREPNVFALHASRGHDVGVLVRSTEYGIAERVVRVPAEDSTRRIDVTLEVPEPGPTGWLRFSEREADPDAWAPRDCRWIAGPETGIVFTVARGWRWDEPATLELPAGRYRVEMDGSHWIGCGVGAPSITSYVTERMEADVRAGETTVARPSLASGPHLDLRIDVEGRGEEVAGAVVRSRWAVNGKWDGRDPTTVEDAWVARVTIHRPEDPTRRELVEWGWKGKTTVDETEFAPCGAPVYSVQRFEPGDYVLTVAGPRIATKAFPVTIPDGEAFELVLTVSPK